MSGFKVGSLQMKWNDPLLCRLLWGQLQSIGMFRERNTTMDALKAAAGLRGIYDRWLEESVAVLARHGYLEVSGGNIDVYDTSLVQIETIWAEWDRQKTEWLADPNLKAQVVLAEAALKALPEIITGKIPATDVIFPQASMALTEGIYKNNLAADYFNEVIADLVVDYVQERKRQDASVRIRILEIGAGTGGTSAMVFRKLKPYQANIEEYCYTDLSRAFFMHAEKEYGPDNPYLTCQIFDLEKPLAEQRIEPGAYELVIATNVLHATKQIRQTLRNAKAALKKNGLLLLNELNDNSLFSHLTFGFLEGWWMYEDAELRIPGCPGLYPETWKRVLAAEGFRHVFFPAEGRHEWGQQIVIAESDGIVRQLEKRPASAGAAEPTRSRALSSERLDRIETQHGYPAQPSKVEAASVQDIDRHAISEMIRVVIREKLAESLKVSADIIQDDESFADYGVDSILGIHLVRILNEALKVELETTSLFDYSSVDELTAHIQSTYMDVFIHKNVLEPKAETEAEAANVATGSVVIETAEREKEIARDPMTAEGIAIIGMSGRFAGSETTDELWQHIANGHDLVGPITRWDLSSHLAWSGSDACRDGSFLDQIDRFDPMFFNISGLEASYMDPQQRLFLEEAWKTLEDAGYAGSAASSRQCGVYVGCCGSDYHELFGNQPPAQSFWGNAISVIPSRIAYFLNLQGPAVTIDTACSSSLTAIHLACQALWSNEVEMALAGGVFVQATTRFYENAIRAGMLSPSGRCYTFDERADGFVPGEGVGVVMLKRLKDALADGDHIYGVIRGSGINQDGTTNGITAPSAKSQERLERQVYDRFQLDPQGIQLMEAHGTGTRLGDPIEFQALTRAFRHYTDKEHYCALGSIKTNIGHSVGAAGVAGVMKILLALKHKQLPPSLHAERINSNIRLEGSPFFINKSIRAWETEPGTPRRAAVSSFGFSGTNAHVVIEEAPPHIGRGKRQRSLYLIVLSARTGEQLRRQAERLAAFCRRENGSIFIGDMSLTLLLGRRHFADRLAFLARDTEELLLRLETWLMNGEGPGIYGSDALTKEQREKPDLKQYGNECINICAAADQDAKFIESLTAVADLYSQGYSLNYEQLFEGCSYNRVSLPTYPFADERYWVNEGQSSPRAGAQEALQSSEVFHPLLHRNVSTFAEQRFTSIFTGKEFFLEDHVVHGQRVLPGVAYLEMARAAVQSAVSDGEYSGKKIRLKNVIWAKPITAGAAAVSAEITLTPSTDGDIAFRVYGPAEAETKTVLCSEGSICLEEPGEQPRIPIDLLLKECATRSISRTECYETFNRIGVNYGPSHQVMDILLTGQGKALAKLVLPESLAASVQSFALHPSLLDGALQAASCLLLGLDTEVGYQPGTSPPLPFALQEMELLNECLPVMWAFARFSSGSGRHNQLPSLDIDLLDEQGNICVRMKGYCARAMEAGARQEDVLFMVPEWRDKAPQPGIANSPVTEHTVILCDPSPMLQASVESAFPGVRCLVLTAEEAAMEQRFSRFAQRIFEETQRLLRQVTGRGVIQIVYTPGSGRELLAGLRGLLKTMRLENPHMSGHLIEISQDETAYAIVQKLRDNLDHPEDTHIGYQGSLRMVMTLKRRAPGEGTNSRLWKDDGVYLITGGAGGLGIIFAKEIARAVRRATIILTGRAQCDPYKLYEIKNSVSGNADIVYKQADMTRMEEVKRLVHAIETEYGGLNGVLHSAGVHADNYLLRKSKDEWNTVLAPKVSGLVHLDEVTKHIPLDVFVMFSSVVAWLGNSGQADYSTANAFMDAYAAFRSRLVAEGQRKGHTCSINWPLWQEGGMRAGEHAERELAKAIGLIPMSTEAGIRAFDQALSIGSPNVIVAAGSANRLEQALTGDIQVSSDDVQQYESATDTLSTEVEERVLLKVREIVSSVIQLPLHRVEADAHMMTFGLDSIIVMQLTGQLERLFGSLPKTLFFEYQNLRDLAKFFIQRHESRCAQLFDDRPQPKVLEEDARMLEHAAERQTVLLPEKESEDAAPKQRSLPGSAPLDIAIIGVAGRYPGARNMDEFWELLQEGVDCVTEIPKERWDHTPYFHPAKGTSGKTNGKWGGFLEGVDQFDPLFFNISPREAELMDPQERLFLQCVYETIEDAGYTRDSLVGRKGDGAGSSVGVFAGVMYEEYQLYGVQETMNGNPVALSGSPASIANRVSYVCNFHGPSVAVDTMCSSSLTVIHFACHSLQRGECDAAIAGGVNVSLHPNKYLLLGQGNFLSTKGRCESFGADGDGYVPGEGVGAVLLKPLAKAIADGDQIYGVIKGTSINHGGRTNGYYVPNPNAQASAIARALKESGINARSISYVEAHGTGTSLGDPIEIAGLSKAFEAYTEDKQYCAIGSVKSNIGHCESAAGIAGLTKVLLQLKHQKLVPSLHADTPNPFIDFAATPFQVQRELGEWERPVMVLDGKIAEQPRMAGLSSFGAGGANAHLIVAEYIPDRKGAVHAPKAQRECMIVLSARSEDQLKERARRLLQAVNKDLENDDSFLINMSYTLQVGREAMEERMAIVVRTIEELRAKLIQYVDGQLGIPDLYRGSVKQNRETVALIAADEDMMKAVGAWMTKGKYAKFLDLWVKGLDIDWSSLYEEGDKPERVSLPTYPFAQERYWLPSVSSTDEPREFHSLDRPTSEPTLEPDEKAKGISAEEFRSPPAHNGLLVPVWDPAPSPVRNAADRTPYGRTVIIGGTAARVAQIRRHVEDASDVQVYAGENTAELARKLELSGPIGHLIWIAPDDSIEIAQSEAMLEAQREGVLFLFRTIKALLALGYGMKPLRWSIITVRTVQVYRGEAIKPAHASLHGLIGSMAKEYPNWSVCLADMETDNSWPLEELFALPPDARGDGWAYRSGEWYRQRLMPVRMTKTTATVYKKGGVYVVIGGTGGIGEVWSEYMIRRYQANIVWIGRRGKDTGIQAKIDRLAELGPAPRYIQADATDGKAMERAYEEIRNRYGRIHGLVHSAIVLLDQSLANMEEERFVAGLRPKTDVSVRMAQIFGHEMLDFVLFFSSMNAFLKQEGQSNYAAGCTFKDAFAQRLATEWPCAVKVMNWGYWGSTGAVSSEHYRRRMAQAGIVSIEPGEAMDALESLLTGPFDQLALMKTAAGNEMFGQPIADELEAYLEEDSLSFEHIVNHLRLPAVPKAEASDLLRAGESVDRLGNSLLRAAASILNVQAEEIEADIPFYEYGFDPVKLAEFSRWISDHYKLAMTSDTLLQQATLRQLEAFLAEHIG
nr:SDR family NAD(P)-dependent oxidoreductase [Lysinibacillus sp. SDF0063]